MNVMVEREKDGFGPAQGPFTRDVGLAGLKIVDDLELLQAVASGGPLGARVDTVAIRLQYSLGEVADRVANFIQRGYVMELRDQIRMTGDLPDWPWVRLTPKGAVHLGYLVRASAP